MSGLAAKLEAAANSNDDAFIREEHESMMDRYDDTVEAIDSVVSSGSDSSGQFNEEVLEFLNSEKTDESEKRKKLFPDQE